MKRPAVAVLVAGLLPAVLSAQQQPAPSASEPPPATFRAEVNYVEVDAFVTDRQGNIVTDLTRNDFEIREDGNPQTISSFSLVNIPIEKPERPLFGGKPIEPDVQTNERLDGRIYLIVLDDLHTAPSNAPRVKAALHRFIEQHFGTGDLAAVVFTGGRTIDAQDFTNNVRLLLAAIDRFTGQKLPSATLERIHNASPVRGSNRSVPGKDDDAEERARRARSAMATIHRLAEFIGNVRGRRKAMLLISEGVEYDMSDLVGTDPRLSGPSGNPFQSAPAQVLEETRNAIAAATRGDVNIYAMDPRGLQPDGEDLIETSNTFDAPSGANGGLQSLREERETAQATLRDLAASTGGFAAANTNNLDGAFDRIVRENSTYYLIGYYPTNDKRDGKLRTIDVRVKPPGLTVRARHGYMAPTGKAGVPGLLSAVSPAVTEALSSPLRIAGVPMRVYASAFKDTPRNAVIPIVVELDVLNFTFGQQNDTYNDKVDVAYAATGSNGKVYTARHTVNVAVKPETYERMKASGLSVITQASLPPGRYQLHVAAGDSSGKVGHVIYNLEVPDFSNVPLSLSGIALTSQMAGQVISRLAASKDWLKDFLPGPVTAMRDFPAGDVLTVFGEVYQNVRGAATHLIDIKTELSNEGNQVIRNVGGPVSSSELERKSGGYGFTASLSLNDVKPGRYVIHVEARSRAGSQPMVSRDIEIRVR